MTVEKLLQKAGNGHTYQLRVLLLFSIQWFIGAMIFSGYNFLFMQPKILCTGKDGVEHECLEKEACSSQTTSYRFDPSSVHSLVYDFDLICSRGSIVDIGEPARFLGALLGAYYYSEIQQKKGRLFAITQSVTLTGVALMASVLSFNAYLNIIAWCCAAFGLFGFLNASVIYFCEISSENLRLLGPNVFCIFWALGDIFLSLVSRWNNSWQFLCLVVMGIPMFVTAFFFRFMKDSPRHLVDMEKFGEANTSLNNIAKINNRPLPEFRFENEVKLGLFGNSSSTAFFKSDNQERQKNREGRSIMTLFKYTSLKTPCWILLVFKIFITISNLGNILAIDTFYPDYNQNLLTGGVIEVFGYVLSAYCVLNFRRKPMFKAAFTTIGAVYILFYFCGVKAGEINFNQNSQFVIFLVVIGKLAVCIAYGNILVYICEVIPTSVRHFAFGLFTAASYFVLMFWANLVIGLRSKGFSPQFLVGVVFLCFWQLMHYVPETLNHPLLEQIKEEDELLLNVEMY